MERSVSKGSYIASSIKYALLEIVAAILVIMWLVPLYAMILGGLKSNLEAASTPILLPPSKPSLDAYAFAWFGYATIPGLEPTLLRYLLVVIPSVLLSVVIGTMTAYFFFVLSEKHGVMSNALFSIMALATFLPIETVTFPLIELETSLNVYNTYIGLIFAMLVFYVPTSALLMSIFLPVVPKYLIESARMDGAGDWTILWRVVFPLIFPGFLSTLIFVFLQIWNEFFIPLILTNTPNMLMLPVAARFYTAAYALIYNRSFAAGVISSLIPLIIFIFLGRYFIRGLAALGGGAKGV
ncbi:glucose ABC transporter permease GlcU [Saccharolobus solfataricus]|uniref:Arabinose ABC transporter permease n=1 Tax=Saccharolobus solfataricus TaxID=2287 RepID=A0A157T691_SACSO|nr:glucose ABC transporter permease GlcU [Saccharolobus solfataricus]SAI86716.1 arabinose ABC transporter permease [Saccharolobus solfataricus]